ncbi:hypothetical protein [Mycobacteroides abscessus]|uniref:hypothetical protein n=1 Tax=Mycobacteroides abscessus TaxID=36809 RepID=UPI0019286524|nr:hypothetical protein [Mycobacteroides abscessus]MBL3753007.1 hypothetical protein [Mycobacteroides abscessus subsp. massiliense]
MQSELRRKESRLRRAAARQQLQLVKFRGRNPDHWLYGSYMLCDPYTNTVVWSNWAGQQGFGLDLEDVEAYLASPTYTAV